MGCEACGDKDIVCMRIAVADLIMTITIIEANRHMYMICERNNVDKRMVGSRGT